ncbi:MAG TPA: hypothetical protein VK827_05810, partial [Lysobacter sp.]|nr:hypothetical protein [Lysobacter sp.]
PKRAGSSREDAARKMGDSGIPLSAICGSWHGSANAKPGLTIHSCRTRFIASFNCVAGAGSIG